MQGHICHGRDALHHLSSTDLYFQHDGPDDVDSSLVHVGAFDGLLGLAHGGDGSGSAWLSAQASGL